MASGGQKLAASKGAKGNLSQTTETKTVLLA